MFSVLAEVTVNRSKKVLLLLDQANLNVSPSLEPPDQALARVAGHGESEAEFEKRATQRQPVDSVAAAADMPIHGAGDLEGAGTREALALYKKLLRSFL